MYHGALLPQRFHGRPVFLLFLVRLDRPDRDGFGSSLPLFFKIVPIGTFHRYLGLPVVRPFFSGLLQEEGARQRLAGALELPSGNVFGLL